jgi:predicted nucleic acid-binding protein
VIVVSDTTPLNYLVLIDAIDVLPGLFADVFVPPAVITELTHAKTPDVVREWVQSRPPWLKIVAPSSRLPSTVLLGDGEAEALSLAKELHIQDVLIDERRGRMIAQREGLTPLPTLAVLERAAASGFLDLPFALNKLQQTSIRVPSDRIDAALKRDAERRRIGGHPAI